MGLHLAEECTSIVNTKSTVNFLCTLCLLLLHSFLLLLFFDVVYNFQAVIVDVDDDADVANFTAVFGAVKNSRFTQFSLRSRKTCLNTFIFANNSYLNSNFYCFIAQKQNYGKVKCTKKVCAD